MGRGAGGIAVVCAWLACGGDGGPTKFASGLDGDRPLRELSASEATKLCKGAQSWANAAIPRIKREMLVCKTGALAALVVGRATPGRLQAVCQETYDGCLQRSGMAPAAINCPTAGPDCTATVGEYEACINDVPASFDRAVAAIPSCDMLTLDAIFQSGVSAATLLPASCATFQMHCPGTRVIGLPLM